MKSFIKTASLIFIYALIMLSLCGCSSDKSNVKEEAYDFEMTLVDGGTIRLSDYRGKKVLLNFWTTWCGHCTLEMPAFQKLADDYPNDLVIIAVNYNQDKSDITRFLNTVNYTFIFVMDTDSSIQNIFGGVDGIPVSFFFDEDGVLTGKRVGEGDYDTYKKALDLQ